MLLSRLREQRKQFVEDSLVTAYHVQVNTDALSIMAEHADSLGMVFSAFLPEQEEMDVVSWDGGSRNLFSFSNNMMGLPSYIPRSADNTQWLGQYAEMLALYDIEMTEAIMLGLDTLPEMARQLNAKRWENVLDKYYETVISPKIHVDSIDLNQVYEEIKEDNPVPESRVFNVLFLADTGRIEAARAMMASGDDVLAAMDRFEEFPPILADGEETLTVPLSASMIPENDREVLWSLESGEEAVVLLSDSSALWLRLDSVNEEHIPSFDEIRDRVTVLAKQQAETSVIEALVDSLSEEYHPHVDEEYFRGFYIPVEEDSTSGAESSMEVTDAL
jgi:hypothetical protein